MTAPTYGPSSAGALGPMQFLPSTWAEWGIDGFGQPGPPDIMNPLDAVPSAARMLCAAGAGKPATLPGRSSPTTTRPGTSTRCSRWPASTPRTTPRAASRHAPRPGPAGTARPEAAQARQAGGGAGGAAQGGERVAEPRAVRVDHEADHGCPGGHADGDAAAEPGHGLGPAARPGLRLEQAEPGDEGRRDGQPAQVDPAGQRDQVRLGPERGHAEHGQREGEGEPLLAPAPATAWTRTRSRPWRCRGRTCRG